jgi:hypothetical protein
MMAKVPIICPKYRKEMHAAFVPDYSDGVLLDERRWIVRNAVVGIDNCVARSPHCPSQPIAAPPVGI